MMNRSLGIHRVPGRVPGFTLLEVMLVLLIIGALAAALAINLVGAGDRARADATRAAINNIKSSLTEYQFRHGRYPSTSEGLSLLVTENYIEQQATRDAWKNPFFYYAPTDDPNRPYELFSAGPDGQPNTPDDISVWDIE